MQECRPRSALRSHSRSPTLRTVRFVRRAVSEDAPKRASSPISDQDDRVDIVAIESDAHLTQPPARRAERHPRWRPSPRSMPLSPAAGRHTSNLELSSDESTAAVAIKSASAPTAASNDGARRRPSRTVVVPPATGSLAAVQRETIGQRQLAMLSIVFTALNALLLLLGVGILIIILSNGRASSDVQRFAQFESSSSCSSQVVH